MTILYVCIYKYLYESKRASNLCGLARWARRLGGIASEARRHTEFAHVAAISSLLLTTHFFLTGLFEPRKNESPGFFNKTL
jgi:hypothetical protein